MCGCVEKMRYSADATFDEVKGLLTTEPSTPVTKAAAKKAPAKKAAAKKAAAKKEPAKKAPAKKEPAKKEPAKKEPARAGVPVSRQMPRPFIVAAAVVPGLVALGVCAYQLSLPNVLFGYHYSTGNPYDDGVYLGAALHLVNGVLPYRDFVLLHPPGITLLMTPHRGPRARHRHPRRHGGGSSCHSPYHCAECRSGGDRSSQPGCRGHDHGRHGSGVLPIGRGGGPDLAARAVSRLFLPDRRDRHVLRWRTRLVPPAGIGRRRLRFRRCHQDMGDLFQFSWRLQSACRGGKTFGHLCLARLRGSSYLACRFSSLLRMPSSTTCSSLSWLTLAPQRREPRAACAC